MNSECCLWYDGKRGRRGDSIRWRKYSGPCVMQVLRKFRSDSVHVAPLETAGIINVEMIPYCRPMSHGTRGHLAWVQWGPQSGGSSLLVVGSSELVSILLCSLSMSGTALSTRLDGGVTSPGILFMTWRAQGVMNGWLFLYRMCCHKASCAVVRLVAFQGVRRKPCMLPPVGGNF